jgi:hypothetical protein
MPNRPNSVKDDAKVIIAGISAGARPTDQWFDALGRLVWLAAQEEGRQRAAPSSLPPGCYFDINGAACINMKDFRRESAL